MFFWIVTALSRSQKHAAFTVIDALMVPLALLLAMLLTPPEFVLPASDLAGQSKLMLLLTLLAIGLGWWFGLTRLKLNAYDIRWMTRTAAYALVLGAAALFLAPVLGGDLPAGAHVLFTLLLLVMSVAWRLALRHVTQQIYLQGEDSLRVLIYGAGTTGQQLVAALRHDTCIRPVAFIDDNPTLQSQVISGLRVHASSSIPALINQRRIDRVVLAMPSISQPSQARITHRLRNIGCEVHALPSFAALVGEGELRTPAAPVALHDLLGRHRLERELPEITDTYSNRSILVTGAGGSIGAELCRQLVIFKPRCVVLVDHSELALYSIDKELRELAPDLKVVTVLGSVLNEALMRDTMVAHKVDVVLHAAAYKHLPMVEKNVVTGLQNNVLGTKSLADAAKFADVDRFILVSSDKAVRPTNVMGASKRLAEMVVQDLAARALGTRFTMVRFGNVMGSSGSVIPLFEEQIAQGGPVTLTDPDVTRYFMTISEAVRLVLLAGSYARGGDVFVLDMGEPVPIRKLAIQMIEGAGYSVRSSENPDGDIDIKVTGLRPGEKLHEELLISPDMLTTPHSKILRAQESYLSEFEMATALKDLRMAIDTRDEDAARAVIARWVERAVLDTAFQQSI